VCADEAYTPVHFDFNAPFGIHFDRAAYMRGEPRLYVIDFHRLVQIDLDPAAFPLPEQPLTTGRRLNLAANPHPTSIEDELEDIRTLEAQQAEKPVGILTPLADESLAAVAATATAAASAVAVAAVAVAAAGPVEEPTFASATAAPVAAAPKKAVSRVGSRAGSVSNRGGGAKLMYVAPVRSARFGADGEAFPKANANADSANLAVSFPAPAAASAKPPVDTTRLSASTCSVM
jgi:hypothetical protein